MFACSPSAQNRNNKNQVDYQNRVKVEVLQYKGRKYEKLKSGAFNALKGTACVAAAVACVATLALTIAGVSVASGFFLPALALTPIPLLLFFPVCFGSTGLMFLAGQQFKQAKFDFDVYSKL